MADVIPFRGYRYDSSVAGDIAKLIAPPYDVIDEAQRGVLFRLSEYNIARITRADRNEDNAAGSPYAAAAELFADWCARGVLKQDPVPAVYVYEQFFEVHDRKFSRTGVIALARIERLGEGVLPHETTLPAPRKDRLDLIRATRVQFGQVFGLYPDPDGVVDSILDAAKTDHPLVQAADSWGHLHRLWAITDSETIARIQHNMKDKKALIADGHHRYEAALAYAAENPDCTAAKYRMMTLVNMSNIGLVILPIHRLVKAVQGFDPDVLLTDLRSAFEIRAYPGDSPAACNAVLDSVRSHEAEGRHAFGLYMGNGNHYTLVLRQEELMDDIPDHSETWRRLDVTILHRLILDERLDITPDRVQAQRNVEYVQDFPHLIREAADRVRSGNAQALFLLNPTHIEEVRVVANNHECMPQKSTFFYPKVYTGLVTNRVG